MENGWPAPPNMDIEHQILYGYIDPPNEPDSPEMEMKMELDDNDGNQG